MKDSESKRLAYEKMLRDGAGPFEDKVKMSLAFLYQDLKDGRKRSVKLLKEIIRKGPKNPYYKVAKELLLTLGIEDFDKIGEKKAGTDKGPQKMREGSLEYGVSAGERNTGGTNAPEPHAWKKLASRKRKLRAYSLDKRKKPSVYHWISKPSSDYLEGSYEYGGVLNHSRAILFIKPCYFLVLDVMETRRSCSLKQYFHMPPEVAVDRCSDGWLLSTPDSLKCLVMHVIEPQYAESDIIKGQSIPVLQGWYGGDFNLFRKAPVLISTIAAKRDTYFIAHLIVPIGKGKRADYKVSINDGAGWNLGAGKPLRLTIKEPSYRTEVFYMPSSRILKSSRGRLSKKPRIRVKRRHM